MPDVLDKAAETAEFLHAVTINNHRQAAKHHAALLKNLTQCLNCEEPLTAGRYCDESCKEDHEKRLRAGANRPRI